MDMDKKYEDNKLTIFIDGRIDTITSKDLEKAINDEIGKFNSLILDFEKVKYISSAGLRVLAVTQKTLKKENTPFIIKNANDSVNEIFRMSGFNKFLTIK